MKTPRKRHHDYQQQDEDVQNITFHISRVEIEHLDLKFIADMIGATLSEQTATSLFGRVAFALERDTLQLFERGLPGASIRSYLRAFHYSIPAWPLLVRPDDPWHHMMAIANARSAECCYHSITRRARYRVGSDCLHGFITSMRLGMHSTAQAFSIAEKDWLPIAKQIEKQLNKLATPFFPEV